jgi:hypothetical protein
VTGYLDHEALAWAELSAERFMMNVALLRVVYARAVAAAPRLALGYLAPLGRLLGDPRGGSVGVSWTSATCSRKAIRWTTGHWQS